MELGLRPEFHQASVVLSFSAGEEAVGCRKDHRVLHDKLSPDFSAGTRPRLFNTSGRVACIPVGMKIEEAEIHYNAGYRAAAHEPWLAQVSFHANEARKVNLVHPFPPSSYWDQATYRWSAVAKTPANFT